MRRIEKELDRILYEENNLEAAIELAEKSELYKIDFYDGDTENGPCEPIFMGFIRK